MRITECLRTGWALTELTRIAQQSTKADPWTQALLGLFHHLHHNDPDNSHETHHCGGEHKDLPYTIQHCVCGKHSIDQQLAVGHGTRKDLDLLEVKVKFMEPCPAGGWHVESGKVVG